MKLEQYLKIKESRHNEEKKSLGLLKTRCLKCLRATDSCFCKDITPISTKTEFIILMHPKEAYRERLGTGRMTFQFFTNAHLLIGANFHKSKELEALLSDQSRDNYLLYPGETSLLIDGHESAPGKPAFFPKKNMRIFILDGTWSCAKSLMKKTPELHCLPRISFRSKNLSRFTIKQQPNPLCLSTIESVYYLLTQLQHLGIESSEIRAQALMDHLDKLVHFQMQCAQDIHRNHFRGNHPRGYKSPGERKPSKKWANKKVYFN